VPGKVSSLSPQVEVLEVEGLPRERETNGILIMKFHVLHVEREHTQITRQRPLRRLAKGAGEIHGAADGGVSRKFAAKICQPERVEIRLVQTKRKLGWIIVAQSNRATNRQGSPL